MTRFLGDTATTRFEVRKMGLPNMMTRRCDGDNQFDFDYFIITPDLTTTVTSRFWFKQSTDQLHSVAHHRSQQQHHFHCPCPQ